MNPPELLPQPDAYTSPWPLKTRLLVLLWQIVWTLLFRPTPKPLTKWRLFLLRLFGARTSGRPFVSQSARIKMPWNLILEDRACLAPEAEAYNLAPIILRARCTVAQQAYLCAGTHDLSTPLLPLIVREIVIGEDAFVGARALILPGVTIGEGAVVGAGAVVAKNVAPWMVAVGNPAREIRKREWNPQQ